MASLQGLMALAILFLALIQAATSAPSISFPLNSQVPPVARVSESFQFTFSPDSFTSTAGDITYTLSRAPSWLQLDGKARSLFGTPTVSDAGPANVILTASDSSGSTSMEITLMVSTDPSPKLVKSLNEQLAAFGSLSGPNNLLFYPSAPFNFAFEPNTFSWKDQHLNFYAVSSDNTPLPSWIAFDPTALRFSGTTPPLTALVQPPQKFMLKLISSDIAGFSGASADFSLTIGSHQLAFDQTEYLIIATKGEAINFAGLRNSLKLDSQAIKDEVLKEVQAPTPDWMRFNNTSLGFDGIPPGDATSINITVTAIDVYGDVANVAVMFRVQSSLIMGTIADLSATISEGFHYRIPKDLLAEDDIEAKSDTIPLVPWVTFNATKLEWSGKIPEDTQPGQILVNLTVTSRASKVSDSLTFTITLVGKSHSPTSTPPSDAHPLPTTAGIAKQHRTSPNRALILSAVIVPLVVIAVAAMLWFCARRYRISRRKPSRPEKSSISRPLEQGQGPPFEVEEAKLQAVESAPKLPLPKRFSGLWKSNPDIQQLRHDQLGMASPRGKPSRPPRPEISRPIEQMQYPHLGVEEVRLPATEPAPKLPVPKRFSGLWKSNADIPHLRREQKEIGPSHGIERALRRLSSIGQSAADSGPSGSHPPGDRWENTHHSMLGNTRTSDASELTNITEMLNRFKSPPRQSLVLPEGQPSVRLVVQSPDNSVISAGRREKYGYSRRGTTYFWPSPGEPSRVSRVSSRSPDWRRTLGSSPPIATKPSAIGSIPRGSGVRGMSTEGGASHSTSELQSESSLGEGRVPLHRSGSRFSKSLSRMSRESSVDPFRYKSEGLALPSRDTSASKLSDMMPVQDGRHYFCQVDEDGEESIYSGSEDEGADDHVQDDGELQRFEYGVASMAQRPHTPATPGISGLAPPRQVTPRIVELRRKGSASNDVETNARLRMISSQEASLASINHTISSDNGPEIRRADHGKAFL